MEGSCETVSCICDVSRATFKYFKEIVKWNSRQVSFFLESRNISRARDQAFWIRWPREDLSLRPGLVAFQESFRRREWTWKRPELVGDTASDSLDPFSVIILCTKGRAEVFAEKRSALEIQKLISRVYLSPSSLFIAVAGSARFLPFFFFPSSSSEWW